MGQLGDVKRRHHSLLQIGPKHRKVNRLLGQGMSLVVARKHLEVTEQAYYRWRYQCGGMKADDAKWLRDLEKQMPDSRTTLLTRSWISTCSRN